MASRKKKRVSEGTFQRCKKGFREASTKRDSVSHVEV